MNRIDTLEDEMLNIREGMKGAKEGDAQLKK